MNKDKNIVRLYLLVALSLIGNVIFILAGHDLMSKNLELRSKISSVEYELHQAKSDVQYLKEMQDLMSKIQDSDRAAVRKNNKEDKEAICDLANRVLKLENEVERLDNVTSTEEISKINEDLRQLKQNVDKLIEVSEKIKFDQANRVSSLRNEIKNLEENLEITNTFQWSAIRKLKQACPWVGLFD